MFDVRTLDEGGKYHCKVIFLLWIFWKMKIEFDFNWD